MTDSINHVHMHREIEEQQRKQKILETLADVQHEIWSHWMRYLFDQCDEEDVDSGWIIPLDKVWRWSRQMNISYVELSEKERDSDRDQAREIIDALAANGFSIIRVAR